MGESQAEKETGGKPADAEFVTSISTMRKERGAVLVSILECPKKTIMLLFLYIILLTTDKIFVVACRILAIEM